MHQWSIQAAALLLCFGCHAIASQYGVSGHVYIMSNGTSANAVLVYDRAFDGTLTFDRSVPTGGRGSGAGLGTQGSLMLDSTNTYLLAANAGNNQISVFTLSGGIPTLASKIASRGKHPVSIATFGNLVYVLNAHGAANITGFKLAGGKLKPIAGSTLPLSTAKPNPAQISFSGDGKTLIVTEKNTNLIDTFTVDAKGIAAGPITHASHGRIPFGFAIGSGNQIVVSEAGKPGSASSYTVGDDGSVTLVTGSVSTQAGAPCWVAISSDGEYAYITDFGAAALSTFSIGPDGTLALVGDTAVGNDPTDIALTPESNYLYETNEADHTIGAFVINADRSLTPITGASGLPTGVTGLVAQ
jgi:6-phosphogluconolactonase